MQTPEVEDSVLQDSPHFPNAPDPNFKSRLSPALLTTYKWGIWGFDDLLEWLTEVRETPRACQYYKGYDKAYRQQPDGDP